MFSMYYFADCTFRFNINIFTLINSYFLLRSIAHYLHSCYMFIIYLNLPTCLLMSLFIRPSDLSVFFYLVWFLSSNIYVEVLSVKVSPSPSLFVYLKMALTVLTTNDGKSSIELAPPRCNKAFAWRITCCANFSNWRAWRNGKLEPDTCVGQVCVFYVSHF